MFGKKKEKTPEVKPASPIEMQAKMAGFMKKAQKFLTGTEEKKAELLEKAKKAKRNNDRMSFKIACTGLAALLSLRNRVEKMVSVMDILSTVRDVSDMASGFLGGMEEVCKDIAVSTKGINFAKFGKMFDSTMGNVSKMFEGLDGLVDNMSLGFDSMDAEIDPDLQRQISQMIDQEEVAEAADDDLDKVIEEKMKRLKTASGS
jgi:hypothetical protein